MRASPDTNLWCRIAKYIVNIRHGKAIEQEDEIQLMHDLVQKYSCFDEPKTPIGDHGSSTNRIAATNGHTPFGASEVIVSYTFRDLFPEPLPLTSLPLFLFSSPLLAR